MTLPALKYGRRYQTGMNRITTAAMIGFHVGAVAAFFFIDSGAILTAIALYIVAGMFGIGMCYHRLLTHRAYKTHQADRIPADVVRDAGARGRPDLLGGDAPHPPSALRSRGRSAHAARGHVVGAHGMDPDGRRHAPRRVGAGALRARPRPRSGARRDLEMALDVERRRRPGAAGVRRHAVRAVGHLLPHHRRPARDVAGQLGHAQVGLAPLRDDATTRRTTGGWRC